MHMPHVPSPDSSTMVIYQTVYVPGGLGFKPQHLRRVFLTARDLSRYSPMSNVCALRYFTGLVSNHG